MMIKFTSSVCLCALWVSSAMAQPDPTVSRAEEPTQTADAKEDTGTIAEIVVTAQRRSEVLQDVPIAITALGSEQLERAQIADTTDLKKVTPGLQFNIAAAGLGQPRIRGVGTAAVGPGIENPVALYVDGVYYASANATLFSLTDVEQIAVLKGPQGTLFGRNATGGLIQITTRQPSETPRADAHITVGNLKRVGADVYLSGGLGNGLSASIAGYYDYQGEGWGRNLATGNFVQTHRNYAGRAKLYWDLADTQINLSADYSRIRSVDPAFRLLGVGVNGQRAAGGRWDVSFDRDPWADISNWGSNLTIRHSFGEVELTSLTAYRETDYEAFFDLDYTSIPIASFNLKQFDKQFSQELQLQSKGAGPFRWTVGGIYFWSRAGYPGSRTFTPGGTIELTSTQRLNSFAAFAQGTYALDDATNLTLGVRYSTDKRDIEGTRILLPSTPISAPQDNERRFSKVTWRASIDHRFSPELLAYASYNRGFKSGAFVGTAFPTIILLPEVLDAFEVGLKSDLFDRRVRFNLSAFYYDYENVQAVQIASGFVIPYNAKGAESYGFDADAIVRIGPNLTVSAGAAYVHGRYGSFTNAIGSTPRPTGGNLVARGFDATGNRLQNTPDWTVNVAADYVIPTDVGDFTLAGSFYHNGGFFSEPENRVRQRAYDVVDASLTWTDPSDKFDLKLWGRNLGNTVYASQLIANDSGDSRNAAAGRSYGVTLGLRF